MSTTISGFKIKRHKPHQNCSNNYNKTYIVSFVRLSRSTHTIHLKNSVDCSFIVVCRIHFVIRIFVYLYLLAASATLKL